MLSCSKGSRGLFVPSRVIGIFTDTTISLSSRSRQRPDHYTIRAGRNLPDKEFRYLLLLTFRHRAGVRLYTASFEFAQPCVFGKQLPGPVRCASPGGEDPLSRSYRVSLPSSLTVIHSSASVCSTRPRVSVSGTGGACMCLAGFLGSLVTRAVGSPRKARHTIRFGSPRGLPSLDLLLHPSTGYSVSPRRCHFSVAASLHAPVQES